MFSNRTRFWLMLILTVIMGYFTIQNFRCGSCGWGIVMLIFTLFNIDSTYRLYCVVGGFSGASMFGRTHNAFHEQKTFKDLDV